MKNRPRYVFDTNVIVSALLFPDSVPFQAFVEAKKRGDILLSGEAIKEIARVLRRRKFDRYILAEERNHFLATLIRESTRVEPEERISKCRDANDNKWLEIAVAAKAERVVTGDEDLLSLREFRQIPIVTPAQFLASLPPK